jgi:hypothetical protein
LRKTARYSCRDHASVIVSDVLSAEMIFLGTTCRTRSKGLISSNRSFRQEWDIILLSKNTQ